MNLADGRLSPAPGTDGIVSRSVGAILFVAARTPVDDVAQLVEVVQGSEGDAPGRQLARRLAVLVGADHDTTLPGFALVAASPAGTYVRAYGSVEVRLLGEGGEEVISAVGSLTGVDREVAGPFHTVVAHRAGEPIPTPLFDVDLQAGTIPAGGFALTSLTGPDSAPAPTALPEAAPVDADAPDDAGVPPLTNVAAASPSGAALVGAAFAATEDEQPSSEAAMSAPEPEVAEGPVAEVPIADGVPLVGEEAAEAAGTGAPEWAQEPTQAWSPSTEDLAPEPTAEPAPEPAAHPLEALRAEPAAEHPGEPLDGMASEPAWADAAEAPAGPLDVPPPLDAAPPVDAPVAAAEPAPYEPATLPPSAIPPVEAAAPVAAAAAGSAFSSVLLGALDIDEVDERDALPVELDPAEVRAPDQVTDEVLVQGVVCSRGHFNDPRSRFCSSCGISMVQNTQVLTNGPRPPLGVMVFEDGATFSLSTDYVVGRQPEVHDLVQQGLALPITVDDPERSISRAHAELRLVEWDVHLVNLSGTNGSFVWDETSQQWIPIPEGQSVQLTPGMRVALGRRSAVFESSLVR